MVTGLYYYKESKKQYSNILDGLKSRLGWEKEIFQLEPSMKYCTKFI